MLIVHSTNNMPPSLPADLTQALRIAFVAHKVEDPTETHPALLLRLARRSGADDLGVGITHLDGRHGDSVQALNMIRPEHLRNRRPGDQHAGAIVISDYGRIRVGDASGGATDAAEESEKPVVAIGRTLVGVMVSSWSFQMHWPQQDQRPTCTIASPLEFGQLGSDLALAIATLNDRFRAAQ